jgi:hypothetical protein
VDVSEQERIEQEASQLLAEALELERSGLHRPEWENFYNTPGKPGLHYPEPYDESRVSSWDQALGEYNKQLATKARAERAEAEASQLIADQPLIRERICEVLKSVNEDAKDLAKIVCAALLPLSIAGTIAIPMTPVLLMGIGLVVWRAGTSGFCAGYNQGKR